MGSRCPAGQKWIFTMHGAAQAESARLSSNSVVDRSRPIHGEDRSTLSTFLTHGASTALSVS